MLAIASLACATLTGAPAGPTLPAPLAWRQALPKGIQIASPPALADGLLVYVEDAHSVVAREAATGQERWRHVLNQTDDLTRPPAVLGERVFLNEVWTDSAGAATGRVLALDLHTGQELWTTATLPAPHSNFGPPVAGGELIYFTAPAPADDALLEAADPATGAVRWQAPLTSTLLTSEPLIDNGLLFITRDHHTADSDPYAQDLLAFDAATGAPRWQMPLGARTARLLAAGGGRVYAPDENGWFWALDEQTGAVDWKVRYRTGSPYNFNTSPVTVDGQRLYFADTDDDLLALDAATGSVAWQVSLSSYSPQRPAVSAGRLYLGTMDGQLLAMDAADGHRLWSAVNPLRPSFPDSYTPPLETAVVVNNGTLVYFNGTQLVALTVP